MGPWMSNRSEAASSGPPPPANHWDPEALLGLAAAGWLAGCVPSTHAALLLSLQHSRVHAGGVLFLLLFLVRAVGKIKMMEGLEESDTGIGRWKKKDEERKEYLRASRCIWCACVCMVSASVFCVCVCVCVPGMHRNMEE